MHTPSVDPREALEAYADEKHRHGVSTPICTREQAAKRAFVAVRDVLNEHHKVVAGLGDPICLHDRQSYPCATVRAIHAALTAQPPSAGPLGAIPRRSA